MAKAKPQRKTRDDLDMMGIFAERHWRKHRPRAVRMLMAQGTLYDELHEAAQNAAEMHERLFKEGVPGPEADILATKEWIPAAGSGAKRSRSTPVKDRPVTENYRITDPAAIGKGGVKTAFKQNVAAIRLLKQIEAESRPATPAEQTTLAQYTGWGQAPQAFDGKNAKWSKVTNENNVTAISSGTIKKAARHRPPPSPSSRRQPAPLRTAPAMPPRPLPNRSQFASFPALRCNHWCNGFRPSP